jgi:hypothetical protein
MRWAAICALALLPGCSLGGDEEPERAGGASIEIAALVRQLELATQRRDAGQVCRDLLTRAARERMGGGRCPRRVARALAGVRAPRVELRAIEMGGSGGLASARLRTESARSRPRDEVVELRRVNGEWRVEALP